MNASRMLPALAVVVVSASLGGDAVAYTETGVGLLDLDRLANPSDGYIDEVHLLRDRVTADLVHLVVGESSVGGMAFLGGDFQPQRSGERRQDLRA